MRKLSNLFGCLAILLSNIMCAVVAYSYRDMLCGGMHMGYSAPPEVAFINVIPYSIGIIISIFLAYHFHKKAKRAE